PWTVGVELALWRWSTSPGHLHARLERAWRLGSPWPPAEAVLQASPRSGAAASPPPPADPQGGRPRAGSTPGPWPWRPPGGLGGRGPRGAARLARARGRWIGRGLGWGGKLAGALLAIAGTVGCRGGRGGLAGRRLRR